MAAEQIAPTGRAIFISYRRDDAEGEAGRLYDDLVRAYGDPSVFMDVAGIQPGVDFRRAIDDNVSCCGVLLAVIGVTWATVTGRDGTRRLDNPEDYVRLEISSALKRGVPVIPVLVHGAHMPALEQLPEDLKELRYRNSVELTHARWNSDVSLLVTALKNYIAPAQPGPAETVHATVPVQLPAPQAASPQLAPAKSRAPAFIALAVLLLLILAGAGYALMRQNASGKPVQTAITPVPAPVRAAPGSQVSPESSAQPSTSATATQQPAKPAAPNQPSAPVSAGSNVSPGMALVGRWRRVSDLTGMEKDGLVELAITRSGSQLMVRAFGQCSDSLCDWGLRKAAQQGNAFVTAPWQPRNNAHEGEIQRSVSVSMSLSGDTLQVAVKNQTVDPNRGPTSGVRQADFKKMP